MVLRSDPQARQKEPGPEVEDASLRRLVKEAARNTEIQEKFQRKCQ